MVGSDDFPCGIRPPGRCELSLLGICFFDISPTSSSNFFCSYMGLNFTVPPGIRWFWCITCGNLRVPKCHFYPWNKAFLRDYTPPWFSWIPMRWVLLDIWHPSWWCARPTKRRMPLPWAWCCVLGKKTEGFPWSVGFARHWLVYFHGNPPIPLF